jgi:hypothetical protein
MNIVWVNKEYPMEHSRSLAKDNEYGVGGDRIAATSTDVDGHRFITAPIDQVDYPGIKKLLQEFVPTVENNPYINILGDYWPDGVGTGAGYDVYHLHYKGLNVMWLMNIELR